MESTNTNTPTPNEAAIETGLANREVLGKGMIPATVEDGWRLATAFAKSGMVPKDMANKPDAVFAAICLGAELGMPPMSAVQNIYVVNGRPTVWGDAMLGICQRNSIFDSAAFREGYGGTAGTDDFFAFTEVRRMGCPNTIVEQFSIADAKSARLWGKQGPWTTHPKRMLKYRARSFALRQAFADVLKGLYTAEEMIDVEPTRPAFVAPEPTESELTDQYRKKPDPPAGGASPDDASAADPGKGVRQAAGQGLCEAPSAGGQTSGSSGGDAERQAVVAETTAAPSGGAATATACGPLRTKLLQLHVSISDQGLADIELGKCGLVDTAEVRSCNNEAALKEAIEALQRLKLVAVPAKGGGAAGKQGKLV